METTNYTILIVNRPGDEDLIPLETRSLRVAMTIARLYGRSVEGEVYLSFCQSDGQTGYINSDCQAADTGRAW